MKIVVLATALAIAGVSVASAKDLCNAGPKESWRPQAELEKQLTDKGWKIRKVKTGEGCYEVYATDKDGGRHEIYYNPKTFAVVKDES